MLITREAYEQLETKHLGPYAVRAAATRGRDYPETEHPYRTAFQRDRDRIVHTTAWRRLEYKTQVFVNYEGDYYRTRLTHTIEAAQIARTIARTLRLNEDLCEAITFAHDLGHPPFGHAGEAALDDLMAEHGGFEHNSQSLRIVEYLEERYPGFLGLNLTWEVREGIVKHSDRYELGLTESPPPLLSRFDPDKMPTFEAQVCRLADEIAYNSHDLDDGLRAGLIDPASLQGVAIWEEACSATISLEGYNNPDMLRHQRVRHIIDSLVTDLIRESARLIGSLGIDSIEKVSSAGRLLINFSPAMDTKHSELKEFLNKNLYHHYRVARMAAKAKRVITELFQAYSQGIEQAPHWVQKRMEKEDRHRVICDYIAGMTDRFILDEHAKLFDPRERI